MPPPARPCAPRPRTTSQPRSDRHHVHTAHRSPRSSLDRARLVLAVTAAAPARPPTSGPRTDRIQWYWQIGSGQAGAGGAAADDRRLSRAGLGQHLGHRPVHGLQHGRTPGSRRAARPSSPRCTPAASTASVTSRPARIRRAFPTRRTSRRPTTATGPSATRCRAIRTSGGSTSRAFATTSPVDSSTLTGAAVNIAAGLQQADRLVRAGGSGRDRARRPRRLHEQGQHRRRRRRMASDPGRLGRL